MTAVEMVKVVSHNRGDGKGEDGNKEREGGIDEHGGGLWRAMCLERSIGREADFDDE